MWRHVVAKLPERWQIPLRAMAAKWQRRSSGWITALVRRILQGMQEQLSPFARLPLSPFVTRNSSSNHNNKAGGAPRSILCDFSSTQVTAAWTEHYEDQVRQNHALIHKVLHYWFGQYEPDVAQKKLWMIAASSSTYRQQIDAEIADTFLQLLCELATAASSSNKSSSDGNRSSGTTTSSSSSSSSTSGSVATTATVSEPDGTLHACRWQQWCADTELYGYAGKLAAIIVLDQFSRHIRRHKKETTTQESFQSTGSHHWTLPPQKVLDQLALRTAQLLTEGHGRDIQCGMIPIPQYIFGLMPYRHASTLDSVAYVQHCVEHAAKLNLQFECMTSRFRKASNRRMAVLQDDARRLGKATTVVSNSNKEGLSLSSSSQNIAAGDDTKCSSNVNDENMAVFRDDDILEIFPFEADMSDTSNHSVVKTITAFLADQGIVPSVPAANGEGKKSKVNGRKKEQQGDDSCKNEKAKLSQIHYKAEKIPSEPVAPCSIIVSLSGGVDSMVIADVLAYLKRSGGYPHLDIVAIHIDYANRPESMAEANYVEKYCRQHGIRFIVRRIDEITRGVTARDEYERQSREVRYDLYRKVAQECATKHSQSAVGVMLGHHRGDLRENVLSNAHKGCGPLDLSGMTAVSQNDGVIIYRPLLPLEKSEVFDYSHRYGVPYFKDTTPTWSTRGKLRNKLLPLLEEIYGEGSMNNLSTLAAESDECRDLLHKALLKPFMDRVVRTPMGIYFETAPFVTQATGTFFWKFVLREVLHSAGLGMFSDKSVVSFLERIRPTNTFTKTIRQGWLQCRRDYAVYLQEDGKVFVFFPESLPWRKCDAFKCFGRGKFSRVTECSSLVIVERVSLTHIYSFIEVDITQLKTIEVGPWIVEAKICDVSESEKDALVKRKAISSMSHFMEGLVEYYLELPSRRITAEDEADDSETSFEPYPLVFISSFRKTNRPGAWKNTDEKLQEILPLLGLTDDAFQVLKSADNDKPVKLVRVTLDRRFSHKD